MCYPIPVLTYRSGPFRGAIICLDWYSPKTPNPCDFSPAKRLNLASKISAGGAGAGVGDAGSLPGGFDMRFHRRFAGGSELEKNIAG